MEKIVTRTKYNRKQHKKFYMFHLFHRTMTIYLLLIVTLIMLVLAIYNTLHKNSLIFSWVAFGITAILTPLMILQRVNSVVKQETPERIKSTDTIEVTKDKLVRSNDVLQGKAVIGWKNIELVCENDNYFYIYTTDTTGIFIVKEDIIEGNVEMFRKIALSQLPLDKKGRPVYRYFGQVKKEYKAKKREEKKKNKNNLKMN